ncbi:hypothetical protein G7L40_20030 [Paenibacillus polymyxa]|uniref:Helicase associated domain n=1 Tax=Paenibacillus polymyxa TaxID=1406 RepID=A0A378Y0R5_PAEPO|nr:helicase associated domain-containing protein [Paenibacillus polymyxa]MBE7896222.1 helicase associated domain-containing protein [Paenibacillus polymyxa]MBG9765847.1 hypothetical protein [Paenibacillus polymyxa]MCC3256751.1 helicase associated domain-containing protein [Paenibacillus polymyxa]QPK54762.1 hypothetical protein G7035_20070 [Paenibacillus polymyxa]QPK59853.1 hypothetical protein G7L40_20030 [Paenibacillus polymyxa]
MKHCYNNRIASWNKKFIFLLKYKDTYKHANVPQNYVVDDIKLGMWVKTQRQSYRKGKLSQDQIEKLNTVGFNYNIRIKDDKKKWADKYSLLLKYKHQYGDCDVPVSYVYKDIKLGMWVNQQRKSYEKNLLSEDRIKKLEDLGFTWDLHEKTWNKYFNLLNNYKNIKGNICVPQHYEVDNIKLGRWVTTQRQLLKNNLLSQKRIDRLNSIGFQWETQNETWDSFYEILRQYKYNHGNCNVPRVYIEGKVNLGNWVSNQRQAYKMNKLSQERIVKLQSIGFKLELRNA